MTLGHRRDRPEAAPARRSNTSMRGVEIPRYTLGILSESTSRASWPRISRASARA